MRDRHLYREVTGSARRHVPRSESDLAAGPQTVQEELEREADDEPDENREHADLPLMQLLLLRQLARVLHVEAGVVFYARGALSSVFAFGVNVVLPIELAAGPVHAFASEVGAKPATVNVVLSALVQRRPQWSAVVVSNVVFVFTDLIFRNDLKRQ